MSARHQRPANFFLGSQEADHRAIGSVIAKPAGKHVWSPKRLESETDSRLRATLRHAFVTLSPPWRRNCQHSLNLAVRQPIALATSSLAIAVGLRPRAGHPRCVQPQSNPEAVREVRTRAEARRWCAGASKPRANFSPEPTVLPVRVGRNFPKKFRPSEGPGGTRHG